ncbi:hypothetical protein ACLOJK_006637 [Asimina triloba]
MLARAGIQRLHIHLLPHDHPPAASHRDRFVRLACLIDNSLPYCRRPPVSSTITVLKHVDNVGGKSATPMATWHIASIATPMTDRANIDEAAIATVPCRQNYSKPPLL